MKKIIFAAIAAIVCLAACKQSALSFEGKVVDATMNTLVIANDGGEITINISDADPTKVEGVLLGDIVKVTYNQVPAGGENFINVVESLVVTAPSYYRVIAGSWLAKGVNDADFYGFTLAEDGSAKSINNLTFRAKEWVLDGEELVLTGEADSTGTVVSRTVVYKIDRLDADSLILSNKETGAVEWACGRESE
ncbi:MAG: hypothetical protein IKR29_01820 [Bacteroidales bacterium]|jgi:hypothetical protein|nr:hypothetical protein [Bacteroidales bacterium]MCR5547949.1 hypothetical protein [Bacteroidales bacterium]